MKITKITLRKDILTVWTDADENTGFNFEINDIVDKADLIKKVEARIAEHQTIENIDAQRQIKFESLK